MSATLKDRNTISLTSENYVNNSPKSIFNIYNYLKAIFFSFFSVVIFLLQPGYVSGQITQRGSASSATTTTTTLTISKPTGLAIGDFMIAQIVQSGRKGGVSSLGNATIPGWTIITGSNIRAQTANYNRATILYKIATATDVSTTNFTCTLDNNSDDGEGAILAFSGVSSTNPFDVVPGTAYNNIANDNILNANAITIVSNNSAVIMFGAMANNQTISGWTAGLSELYDLPFNATANMGFGAAVQYNVPAGSTGNKLANLSGSAFNGSILIALRAYVPTCTTPVLPANGSANIAVNSSFSWNSVPGTSGYRLYLGTDAAATNLVNGADLGNVTSYTPASNLNFLTTYYWKIVPYNSVGSATGCSTWSFVTEDVNWCNPVFSTGTSFGDYISLVQLGSINNITTESTISPYYTYYNALSTDLYSGSNYTITLGVGTFGSGNNIAAWIDFNHDGDFNDTGEKLGELNNLGGNATGTINFTVPLGATLGTTRLRVRESWNMTSIDPCSTYNYGETEDYNVNLLPPCTPPGIPTLSASNSTICAGNSVTLSITAGNLNDADHWQWYSGSCGGTAIGQGTTISVTPLTTTTYYARGEGNCDGTSCGSVTVTVNPAVPVYSANISDASCPSDADGAVETTLPVPVQFNDPDYIDINSMLLSNRSEFTLEGWIKVDLASVGSRISLFGQNDAIEFGFMSSTQLMCWSQSGGSVAVDNAYPNDNGWHHVAAVGNGTSIILYIDGLPVATGGSSTGNYGSNTTYSSKIGAGVWDPTGGYFPGSMLKVGYWSVALNATQINNLATGYYNYSGSETGLLAGYNFFEGTGTTLSSEISGTDGTFNGTPTWNDPYSYSWTKTGDGSFSSSLKNLTGVSVGEYNLTVTLGSCTRAKSFTVNNSFDIPAISTVAAPPILCVGDSFNPSAPSVNDNGSALLSQGWEMETSAGSGIFISLTVPHTSVLIDDGKKLRYFAANSCGSSLSNEVSLSVSSPPLVTVSSNNGPICSGDNAEFTLTGTTDATVTYNINGGASSTTTLSGGTAVITVNSVTADQTLNLISVSIGSCSTSLSESSVVTIYAVPTAILSGNTEICAGSSANLSVEFTGTPPYSITYTDGTTPVTINNITNNPQLISVSPSVSATYTLSSFSDANCSGTTTGSAGISVIGNIVHTPVNDTTICPGGTATLKIKLYEQAVLFDGNNGRISISNSNEINTSNWSNRTVSLWFKANNVTTRQMIYEEGAQVNGFSIYLEGGYVYVHAWESNLTWGEVRTSVNSDTWYNIAFVFDAAASDGEYFKGYLNGVYFGGNSDPAATNGMNAHSGDINIGMNGGNTRYPDNSTSSNSDYFDGYVDEFKLWNRSLSGSELQSERWNVNDGTQSGTFLIVYYNFNNDTGTTATDETGGNNGAISGGVSFVAETPFTPAVSWAPGGMTGFVENVNPSATTNYTYTLTHPANSCETKGTITVAVDSPVIPAISGNGTVCPGDDAIFTISGTPGDIVDYDGDTAGTATINAGGTATVTISAVTADVTLNLININNGSCDFSLTGISETVTVEDIIYPTITCPSNVNVIADVNSCYATGVALGTPVVNDNCGVDSYYNDAPVSFPVGTTTVTWTVTDNSGLTATCEQTVTINPSVLPDAEVEALTDDCQSGETGTQSTISWTIHKLSGIGNWNFTYTINDGSSDVATGTRSSISAGSETVNYVFDNEAGTDKTFTITISSVTDSCGTGETNMANNSDTVTLFGVPATSDINSN